MYMRIQGFTAVYMDKHENTRVYRSIHGYTYKYRGVQEYMICPNIRVTIWWETISELRIKRASF